MRLWIRQTMINIVLVVLLALSILISISRYINEKPETYYNKARILLSNEVLKTEQGDQPNDRYVYYILDLSGRVTASNHSSYSVGELLNLQEAIQTDNSYYEANHNQIKVTFPLRKEGNVAGFVVFHLNKELVRNKTQVEMVLYLYGPIIIGSIICLMIAFYRSLYLKRRILKPIKELATSSNAILNGNYDLAVLSTKSKKLLSSEIDELTYGFELMRDELKNKEQRESKLKCTQKEMISCISHDLKTPISTIKAYAEAIRDGLAGDSEKQEKYVGTIIYKTEILTKMMNDLLDHSNAELNELTILKKEEYIGEFFDQLIKELEIHVKQHLCSFQGCNRVPNIIVSIDSGRIIQVIYNLIENALKYMDKKERSIIFSTEYIKEDQSIYVKVKDNGPGISLTDIPYVFDRFYRAEKSRSMSVPGSGLGLSICKYIVEAHGGEIHLESKTGVGCEFVFSIPVR